MHALCSTSNPQVNPIGGCSLELQPPTPVLHAMQALVQGLWWQAHSKDTKKAAQASFQEGGRFDVWELDTAVRAADLLLWPGTLAIAQRANAGV